MNILGFDCSTSDLYLFLKTDKGEESVVFENLQSTEFLIEKIDKLLKKHKISISEIDILGVGVGPGSFTGARVSVVTAKAFASVFSRMKIVSFTSFDALSYNDVEVRFEIVEGFSDFLYLREKEKNSLCLERNEIVKIVGNSKFAARTNLLDLEGFVSSCFDIGRAITREISKGGWVDVTRLEPLYLRASQAEIQMQKKREGKK